MRAQLIEFIAESCISWRNGASANIAFTRSWQSSNVPSTAMLATFGAATVVIWRRCTSLMRPCGCRNAMSMRSRPAQASIAAEPVSPEVAPTIVTRASRVRQHVVEQAAEQLQRHVLERRASGRGTAPARTGRCRAGPAARRRDGRSRHRRRGTASASVAKGMASPTNGWITRAASAWYGRPRIARQSAGEKCGQDFGHIQPAVLGQAGQQHAGEVADRRLRRGWRCSASAAATTTAALGFAVKCSPQLPLVTSPSILGARSACPPA